MWTEGVGLDKYKYVNVGTSLFHALVTRGPSGRQMTQARCGGRFATTRGCCCYHSEGGYERTQWVSGLQSPLPMPWSLKELVAKAGSLPAIPASEHGSPGRPAGTLTGELDIEAWHSVQERRSNAGHTGGWKEHP